MIKLSLKTRASLGLLIGGGVLTVAFTNCSAFNPLGFGGAADYSFTSSSFGLNPDKVEMVLQPDFAAGVSVVPACRNAGQGVCDSRSNYRLNNPLHPEASTYQTPWEFAQWDSTMNLPTTPVANSDGSYTYGDAEKSISFYPDGRARFVTSGLARYGGAYNTERSHWLGMIAQQPFTAPGGVHRRASGSLARMKSAMFSVDVQLISDEKNIRAGYEVAHHASQFPIFFTVQNLTPGHPEFGRMIWLGIPVYDDRYPFLPGNSMMDIGTNALMYSRPYTDFATKSVHSGQWTHLEADLLPMAKEAVALGVSRGVFSSADLDLYHIGGMNVGTEVTGLNVITMDMKNLSLKIDSPDLLGSSPIALDRAAAADRRTVKFESSGGTSSEIFVADLTSANSNFKTVRNASSGRSIDVRVNLDADTHAVLSVDPVNQPYYCYDNQKSQCELVRVPAGFPDSGTQVQNCYSKVALSGALAGTVGRVANDLNCNAPQADTPEGFWQLPGQSGIFYSNGQVSFCVFVAWDTYLRWHNGDTVVDGFRQLPRNMENHGVCK